MPHRSSPLVLPAPGPSRRRFVQGLAAGGVLLGAAAWSGLGRAQERRPPSAVVPELRGTEFHLVVEESAVNFTGRTAVATTINGSLPAPTLRWKEGETVTIRVTNKLRETSSIHWHGIILPYEMDGVPGISFAGIPPGQTFTYRFKIKQSGTYWYHSHSGFQELTGMYGAIIIDPAEGEPIKAQREHVILLSDWMDEDPMAVFSKLKVHSGYYNFNQPTAPQFLRDVAREGWHAALDQRTMWNQMRMSPTDLSDLSGAVLTFLMNGVTPAGNWTGLFRPGERVRLRFINGAGNTFYDVRIPGLKLSVVQADGVDVEPVSVDEFRFGPGETYDVIVEPRDEAYTLFAQTMDRTGHARGTLAVRAGAHGGMAMDHGGQGAHAMHGAAPANPLAVPSTRVRHARTEYGPGTDMRVDMPRTALDDPGIGLRNNGRRVLTLADLHTPGGPLDPRGPEREIELHLTGNMERYTWSIDGLSFGDSRPLHLRHGERLRVILHNDTMMTHPMHLHGMWSELESPDGRFLARRHTLPVQPAQRVSVRVTADALGRWVWHCHLMFHMDAGMFREVVVS